jgi:tetratricopeptide (TPR) repeat protein
LAKPVLKGATVMGDDPAAKVLEILSSRLVAEIAAAEGRGDAAQAALAHGVELEAALEATEPPLLASSSRLALGSLMLRLQRWSDAERAYREELVAQPASGWALAGLEQALAGQGRAEEAQRARTEAERAWSAADTSVRRIAMR